MIAGKLFCTACAANVAGNRFFRYFFYCFENANYLQNVLTFFVALKYKNAVRLQIKNANCLQNVPVRRECRCFAGSCVKVLSNSTSTVNQHFPDFWGNVCVCCLKTEIKLKKYFFRLLCAGFWLSGLLPAFAGGKIKVVATVFPEYDWIRNIAGDKVELVLLADKGTDMHSWQPSSMDMVKVSTADVFVYIGGESDKWVEGALATVKNKNRINVNLMEVLKDCVLEEEIVEGMEAEHEHGEADYEHGEGEHEDAEFDEHVWLSVKNARIICDYLTDVLCKADMKNAQDFRDRNRVYQQKLEGLDNAFSDAVKKSSRKEILVADRFPFRYLVEDYGLGYYAAFPGCSAETEASFKTVGFLVSKLNEKKFGYVLVLENSDCRLARTLIRNSKQKSQKILELNSLQSVSKKQLESGISYIDIMEKNLAVLKTALE